MDITKDTLLHTLTEMERDMVNIAAGTRDAALRKNIQQSMYGVYEYLYRLCVYDDLDVNDAQDRYRAQLDEATKK